MHRHLIASLIVILVYGCVPAPTIYYKPESAVGRRVHIGSTSIAPADGWEMTSGDATIRVQVTRGTVRVSLRIPPGSHAVFSTTDIRVISDGLEEVLTIKTLAYDDETRAYRTVPATELLEGGSVSVAFGADAPREYSTSLHLNRPVGDSCEILLPDLSVDGEVHSFGPVRFSKKLGGGIFFING